MPDLVVFVIGLVAGSFLNGCIVRLPQGQSAFSPIWNCDACGRRLSPWALAPVLGYLLFRGRCRSCGSAVSSRKPAVELLTGLLFVWCFSVAGVGPELAKALLLTSFLVVITVIDIDHQLILDKVLLWFGGTGLLLNLLLANTGWGTGYSWPGWLDMVIAVLTGGGVMLLVAVVSRGGMGGGDIKFIAALGLWFGWKLTLLVLLVTFIAGGLGGVLVLVLGFKGRKDFIPFGPFIALGAFIAQLYGYPLIAWYLEHFLAQ